MILPLPSRRDSLARCDRRANQPRRSTQRRLILEPLEGRDMPSGWHNAALPEDVNGDGLMSPSDALLAVNYLNAGGPAVLPALEEGQTPTRYYDVNNDGRVSAMDALLVVNWLNRNASGTLADPSPDGEQNLVSDPSGLMLTSDASDRIIVRWTPAAGAVGSIVWISEGSAPAAGSPGGVVTGSRGVHVFTKLVPNTRYWARVASLDDAGNSTEGVIETVLTRPLEKTNKHQLDRALTAGISHLRNIQDKDNSNLPFFFAYSLSRTKALSYGDMNKSRDEPPHMKFDRHFVSNVTARSLYAILSAANSLGIEPPADVVANYAQILLKALHRPRNGDWSDTRPENQLLASLISDPTAYRSQKFDMTYLFNAGQGFRGMLALATLMPNADQIIPEYGRSLKEIFETSVFNLRRYYVYDGEIGGNRVYNWEQYRNQFGLRGGNTISSSVSYELSSDWSNLWKTWADPHLIYPLVKYYEATGHQSSLDLALELRDLTFGHRFPRDPAAIPASILPHMFETTAEMNAYSRLALVTGDADMMERVRLRYEYLRDSGTIGKTGWVPETKGNGRDAGEINNTGELIETALNFAEWGWTEYYQDVERFTRGHLLPAQLLDTSFVSNGSSTIDGRRFVADRLRGAFGFPAPYGQISTKNSTWFTGAYYTDVTGGGVAALAEVQRHIYTRGEDGSHKINLLFDFENDQVQVTSPYPGSGELIVTPKTAGDLLVRIPQWADRAPIEQAMADQRLAAEWNGEYLKIRQPAVGRTVAIPMPLPRMRQTDVINGRTMTIEWLGDSVAGMSRMGTPQPFFPAI